MTAPPPDDHLDDEALSSALDDADAGAATVHLEGCAACAVRLAALRVAREAVATAAVAPLPTSVVTDLVARAMAPTSDSADRAGRAADGSASRVVPLAPRRRGRRLQTPPPAWLAGAAAGLAVVVGLAGLALSGDGGDDHAAESARVALDAEAESGTVAAAGSAAGAGPEVVVGDLGDLSDVDALEAALAAPTAHEAGRTAATAGRDGVGSDESADRGAEASGPAGPLAARPTSGGATTGGGAAGNASTAPSAAPAPQIDRAQCRADAERIGGGRLGALLTTATLRWAGEPAEVLVFALTEPAAGFSRQALVLARPGCGLLADPRW